MTQTALRHMIRENIVEVIREILADPDHGLEIKKGFATRLQRSMEAKKKERLISLDTVLARYGK